MILGGGAFVVVEAVPENKMKKYYNNSFLTLKRKKN
jgi:hypothetical protein